MPKACSHEFSHVLEKGVITMVILQIRTYGTASPTPEISTTTFDVTIIELYITVMINGSTKP